MLIHVVNFLRSNNYINILSIFISKIAFRSSQYVRISDTLDMIPSNIFKYVSGLTLLSLTNKHDFKVHSQLNARL